MILKESVIDNWGFALKNIAVETNNVDEFIHQSNLLIDLLKDQTDFINILNIRTLDFADQKLKIIDEVFGKTGFNQYLVNTMKILAEDGTFTYARAIFKNMRKKLTSLQNIIYGVVWSTFELEKTQVEQMESKLSIQFKKQIKLVNKIDEKLIGGVQVIVANKIFDGSIKGRLDELRYETLKNK